MGFTDPTVAGPLFDACARAGVSRIKLGYWRYSEGVDYREALAGARQDLEGFAKLSGRYGVQSCCHTYSGGCLGSNCAAVRHLVQGFDPKQVGVCPDFGHMALDGDLVVHTKYEFDESIIRQVRFADKTPSRLGSTAR